MRIKTYFLHLRFWQDLEDRHTKENAELIRLQTFYLINIQLDKQSKLKRPADLWNYEWDIELMKKQINPISEEKTKKMLKHLLNE